MQAGHGEEETCCKVAGLLKPELVLPGVGENNPLLSRLLSFLSCLQICQHLQKVLGWARERPNFSSRAVLLGQTSRAALSYVMYRAELPVNAM